MTQATLDPQKKLAEEEKQIDQKLEKEKELLRLRQEKVSAKIDRDVAKGDITEPEGLRRKGAVEASFAKEQARVEDEARKSKMDQLSRAHMAAQQDFRGALDANEDAVARVKAARDVFTAFERGEGGVGGGAEQRKTALEAAGAEEKAAIAEVAKEQQIETELGRPYHEYEKRLLGKTIGGRLLGPREVAEHRLASARGAIKSILGTGEAQGQKRQALADELQAAQKFETETVQAAAGAKSRAELTRAGVVGLGREGTTTAAHSETTAAIRSEIAQARAEKAEAEQARREGIEALRQSRREQAEMWREIKTIHQRQEADQGR